GNPAGAGDEARIATLVEGDLASLAQLVLGWHALRRPRQRCSGTDLRDQHFLQASRSKPRSRMRTQFGRSSTNATWSVPPTTSRRSLTWELHRWRRHRRRPGTVFGKGSKPRSDVVAVGDLTRVAALPPTR